MEVLSQIRFKDFDAWDVKQYLSSLIVSNQTIVKLSQYIKEEKNKIKPFESPKDDFKILGVNNKTGLFDNEIKKGNEINQPYKIVKDGFLAFNPYRINVGSIGLKTDKQQNNLISPAYVVFSCKEGLSPEYLFMIFKTDTFNQIIKDNTKGSVRQILSFDILERLQIPLPPLKLQKQLVKKYQDKLNLAKQQTEQAQQKEAEIEAYLYKELGIELPKEENQNDDILQFVQFKNLDRWDVIFLLNKNQITSSFNIVLMNEIIDNFLKDSSGNSLRLDPQKHPNKIFSYIGMENIEKESGKLLDFQGVKGIDIKSQTIKLPKGFFLYGKLRPYLNKYFYNNSDDKNIITSSEFFAFSVKKINEMYFKFCLSSSFIQHQITNHMKGARMPRIGESIFKNLQIPLPPLEIQNQIASHIQNIKNEIQSLKQQAEQNQKNALSEFEAEIFTRQASTENNNAS